MPDDPNLASLTVKMHDGEPLDTRVWLPAGEGPFPVILGCGYDPGIDWHAERFVESCYVYVGQ
jgi:hypothetical protein